MKLLLQDAIFDNFRCYGNHFLLFQLWDPRTQGAVQKGTLPDKVYAMDTKGGKVIDMGEYYNQLILNY